MKRKPTRDKRLTCPLCGNQYNDNGSDMCPICKKAQHTDELLAPTNAYGEIICWKDGREYELLSCMERKHNAIVRFRQGKDYEMPWCMLCGNSDATTPRQAVNAKPLTVTGRSYKRTLYCQICHKPIETTNPRRKYCDACGKDRARARDKARAKERKR